MKLSFKSTLSLFYQYSILMDQRNKNFNKEVAMEARKKMEQLDWAINKIIKLDRKIKVTAKRIFSDYKNPKYQKGKGIGRLTNELIFLTEAFYYFAFRLVNIINGLPGLDNCRAEKINGVRNMLLEHPEDKKSRIFLPSFSSGGPNGPIIKGVRYSNQINLFLDQGLYINTKELIDKLNLIFTKYLTKRMG